MSTEANCPTTGEQCAYRSHLEDLHQPIGFETAVTLGSGHPFHDGPKLKARLMEHTLVARTIECTGMQDGICPTAERMKESPSRKGAKRLLGFVTKR